MNRLYKLFLMGIYLLLFGAFTSISLAQVPDGGAINVAINTTYDVPDGSPDALADEVEHDLAVLNSAGDGVIGDVTTFEYDTDAGNPGLAGPVLVNYTDYQWVVVLTGEDPTDPASGVKFGPFTFTTIGPEITLTGGGGSIAENDGDTELTVTASAEIGKDLSITVGYTGTATITDDYTNTGGGDPETIIIAPDGDTPSNTTTITGVPDTFLEGNETVVGEITASASYVVGGDPQTITITDAESLILSGGATINEAATTDLTATVSDGGTLELSTGDGLSITLTYSGTADRPGDYNNSGNSDTEGLTLLDGTSSISTTITPVNDDLIELDETVIAAMTTSDVTGLTLEDTPQTVTITDDTETVLLTPLDDAVGQVLFTPLTWSVVLGADEYRLFVNTTEEFDGIAIIEGVDQGDNQAKVLSGLSNATEYFWRVEPRNEGTRAASSDEINSFTTSTDKLVTLTFPKSGETVLTLAPTLFWTVTNTEAGLIFEYQINTTGTFTDIDPEPIEGTTATSVTTAILDPGETYSWRVRSKTTGNLYSQWSTVGTFVTSASLSATPTPIITWPLNDIVLQTTLPTFYWYPNPATLTTGVTGITYIVEYDEAADNFGSAVSLAATSGLSKTATAPLTPGTDYEWRVRAGQGGNFGSYSATGTFSIAIGQGGAPLPVLSWPISNVTVYSNTPTLYWYLSSTATGTPNYHIRVDDFDDTFGSIVASELGGGLTDQFWTVDEFLAPGTYFWQVRTNNGGNQSAYVSTNGQFTVASSVSTAPDPVLSWPIGGATVFNTKPTLYWYLSGTAPGGETIEYDIEVDNDANFGSVTDAKSDNTTQSYTVVTALTPGTYYWRVKTNNVTANTNSGFLPAGDGTAANSFVVSATASGVAVTPTPIYPTGNVTVGTLTPTLSWFVNGVLAGDETYTLELKPTSIAFDNTGLVTGIGSQSTTTITLTAGTAYRWRVLSVSATNGTSSFSAEALFTTSATLAPPPPIGGGPINGAIIANGQPDISWFLPTAPKTELMYKLQISEDASMNTIAFEFDDIDAFHIVVNTLKGGTIYYWRVQSKDPQGVYSAHSIVSRFATGSVTAIDNELVIPQKFTLEQNYPNPFNPATTIRFALPEASFVILRIYNMLGQEVKTLVNGEKNAGTYNVQWRGDNNFGVKVSSGTYIYRVIAGQNIFVKKMVLLK